MNYFLLALLKQIEEILLLELHQLPASCAVYEI